MALVAVILCITCLFLLNHADETCSGQNTHHFEA